MKHKGLYDEASLLRSPYRKLTPQSAAMRVRRGVDNEERDLPFAADGFVDCEALLDFAKGGDLYYVGIVDAQSPNANHLSYPLAIKQPRLDVEEFKKTAIQRAINLGHKIKE